MISLRQLPNSGAFPPSAVGAVSQPCFPIRDLRTFMIGALNHGRQPAALSELSRAQSAILPEVNRLRANLRVPELRKSGLRRSNDIICGRICATLRNWTLDSCRLAEGVKETETGAGRHCDCFLYWF